MTIPTVTTAIAVVVTIMIVIITTDRIVLTDPIDPTGRIVQTGVMGQA